MDNLLEWQESDEGAAHVLCNGGFTEKSQEGVLSHILKLTK